MSQPCHAMINPAILYWGTPVVLITTSNEDGTANIAPMSSAWWLADRCMLGLASHSQTTINLLRTKQCVLNLPSDSMTDHVNRLARTTGSPQVPETKISLGYRFEKDKFGISGLTPLASEIVEPSRIQECPVQMEAQLVAVHEMMSEVSGPLRGFTMAIEVKILRTYCLDSLRMATHPNRIDTDAWRPMIMAFQQLYGLQSGRLATSSLAAINEEKYRLPA